MENRDFELPRQGSSLVSGHITTIVTAFYPFKKAKHTSDSYNQWLMNFLAYVDNPMVIFTSEKQLALLYELRNNLSNKMSLTMFITNFSSPHEMPPVKKLKKTFLRQLDKDPERSIHSLDLYAIWCAKSYMLNLSSSLNPFKSRYFLWIDGGSFRNSKYRFRNWPDPKKMSIIFDNNERLLLGLISPLQNNSCRYDNKKQRTIPRYDLIEGGIIGGSLSSIQWWTKLFYDTIDEFINMNEFIGKDQHVMNFIALSNPWKITVILAYKAFCDDIWFLYGPLLAADQERQLLFGKDCQINNATDLIKSLGEICFKE